jgi:hypothetical protein
MGEFQSAFAKAFATFVVCVLSFQVQAQKLDSASDLSIEVPQAEASESTGELVVKVGRSIFTVVDPTGPQRENYEMLPDKDKASFHRNRKLFLSQVARALSSVKLGFGFGSLIKDHIDYHIQKLQEAEIQNQALALQGGVAADYKAAASENREAILAEQDEKLRKTVNARSVEFVQSAMSGIDQLLWTQAPIFSNANEFGVVAAMGVEALAGVQGKGGWGGLIDLGISIGYNRDTQALVLQVFREVEKYKTTTMRVVALAGFVTKDGIYIANQLPGKLGHEGVSFYPPMAPGYSSITSDSIMAGFSSGLTWPPSPLGDMLTYTNSLDQNMMLRVTVSKLTPGFLRVESGLAADLYKMVVAGPKLAIEQMQKLFGKRPWTEVVSQQQLLCTSALR